MDGAPLISIVTATYNRSNVLRYAIESARWQTVVDWELLVIGDACTDDTEQVVATIGDPRIRFFNLEKNIGEQSGPNNAGVRQARGQYLAFLNHDDLWLPHHLQTLLTQLEQEQADMTFSLTVTIDGDGSRRVTGACSSGSYKPGVVVPATSWLLTRELAARVGPWRFYQELYDTPSIDWIDRAWKQGARIRLAPRLTVVKPNSASRRNSYKDRDEDAQRESAARLRDDPEFVERQLTELLLSYAAPDLSIWNPLKRAAKNLLKRIAMCCGIRPSVITQLLQNGLRKGTLLDRFRRTRGLPLLERRNHKHVA